jgi:hypothetical protein
VTKHLFDHRIWGNLGLLWLLTLLATWAWPSVETEFAHDMVLIALFVYALYRGVRWVWRRARREIRIYGLIRDRYLRERANGD